MNLRRFYAVSGGTLAAQLVVTAWGLARVGPDATVPVHWSVTGNPDGWAPAWIAFLIGPAVTVLIAGLMAVVPRIEPRRENLRRSADAYRTVAVALVMFLTLLHLVVVAVGVGVAVPVGTVIGAAVGVMFAIIGNVLSTVRSNFLFGVRTPWTLSSDRSWDRTHRLVGRLFVATGLATAVVALTGQLVLVFAVMIGMVVLTLVGGVWYSYRVWAADPDRRPLRDLS